jgi:hypothetical protein
MMGFAAPTTPYQSTVTISSNMPLNGPTVTAWAEPQVTPYTIVIYANESEEPAPVWKDIFGPEPFWKRRWRLSLEAIDRYRRAARRFRLRVAALWKKPVSVRRVCSQAGRWRVLA